MLPTANRLQLRKNPEFFTKARRAYSPLFVVFWRDSADTSFQGTVIVSKKISSKASDRNAIKRKVRNALLPYCKESLNLQVVVSAHPNIRQASFAEIELELQKTMSKIHSDQLSIRTNNE